MKASAWADGGEAALLTDLYELTMMQAYFEEGLHEPAVFDLFFRKLPPKRGYLLAAGLETCLSYLESLRFSAESLDYLASLETFSSAFLDYLADFRFTGDVRAVPEGTPVFPNEPLLEVEAPLPQAQLAETFLLNQVHLQTLLASKASRVVDAAAGRPVVDFGARRMHGIDASLKAARAFHIAGLTATSNVLAGRIYGIPVTGTMAHSYIEAHDDEVQALEAFAEVFPETVLLVDTYDTLEGIRRVADMARRWGDRFRVRAVRLDSGDLAGLAAEGRRILDEAGLEDVRIFASGSLDEYTIRELLRAGAPIDAFGVGTHMGVSEDAPFLDSAYKLAAYAGRPRMKLATHKVTLPGRKQVYRTADSRGAYAGDVVATADEPAPAGAPLLAPVMASGERLPEASPDLEAIRAHTGREKERLPPALRAVDPGPEPFPVAISEELQAVSERLRQELTR